MDKYLIRTFSKVGVCGNLVFVIIFVFDLYVIMQLIC